MRHPTRRVETWSQRKADIAATDDRLVHAGHLHESAQSSMVGSPQRRNAPNDNGPIFAAQGNHVRDGSKGRERTQFGGFLIANDTYGSKECAREFICQTGTAEISERICALWEPGIDNGVRKGQMRWRLVVVGDDHIHPPLFRQRHRLYRTDAAVHGDDQRDALRRKFLNGTVRHAIAVLDPVW